MNESATPSLRPVFVLSLPRSGSTLLQKMLAVSPQVATVAEPWICLPLAAMLEPHAIVAEYWHENCAQALEDLFQELPGGRGEYARRAADFVRGIYGSVAGDSGATVFVDKTPRYYLIVPFLAEAFPDARFVFLFRNPLEVLASILKAWHKDRIGPLLKGNYVDLVRGPGLLAEAQRMLGDRALSIHYSRLVADPEAEVKRTCAYLDIPFEPAMLTDYRQVEFKGRMGDPEGARSYDGVSTDSLAKWKRGLGNFYRKAYARRYVRFLGPDTLAAFGLEEGALLAEIDAIPTTYRGAVRDAAGHALLTAVRWLNHHTTGTWWSRRGRRRPWLPYG